MSNHMTRWIEDAEARRYTDTVGFERSPAFAESRSARLRDTILKMPSWLRRHVSW
jgi:hypothetical protein